MERLIQELRKRVAFKDSTAAGDLVLIAAADPEMVLFAKVLAIEPDATRKESWWHVTMCLLGVPIQTVTWTLREPQFTGRESFTMGGKGRFIQAVRLPEVPSPPAPGPDPSVAPSGRPTGLRRVK